MSQCQVRLWRTEGAVPVNMCNPEEWSPSDLWFWYDQEGVARIVVFPEIFDQSLFSKVSPGSYEELWGVILAQDPIPLPNHKTFSFISYDSLRDTWSIKATFIFFLLFLEMIAIEDKKYGF